ncbi:MAG: enoyl-CoA hydratase-related protein [Ignavibacteriota bacterium]|nr:enoyl-CoA hydratase-related protein [Ignavibacteriota bacterium]
MEKLKLNYLHNNSVAQVILNSPKGNVLDSIMMTELLNVLNDFKSNSGLKSITFEGEGDHFSFGASVEEHRKENAAAMLEQFHSLFYAMIDLGVPSISKISGQCLGGGLELALISNLLFADKTAKLGQPEIVLGVFPPPASLILPMKIGNSRAEEILLTGKIISADEGKTIGLINDVFESKDEMNGKVDEYIQKYFLPRSASSLRYAVKASRTMFNHILENKLKVLENMYTRELMNTEDANEGINSFLEKRKPEWKNN